MGMCRWVSRISCLHNKATFVSSYFALGCLDFNSLVGPCYHVISRSKECHHANRRRGERRAFDDQMCMPFDTAFPLSGSGYLASHHCFSSAGVQAAHTLPNTPAQNSRNPRQKTMLSWSLAPSSPKFLPRPNFGTPHRNYGSRAASGYTKSGAEMTILKPDESNREIVEDEDEIFEKKEGNDLEVYGHSGEYDFQEVERVYKVVEELFALDRNMETVLDQCGVNPSHSLVYHVLRRFSNARKPALRFFNWAGQQAGFSHNSVTYNMMVSILGRNKQFVTMGELLEDMGKKGSDLTIETFEIVIKAFAAGREMKKALQMFTWMERYNLGANIDNFNFLLDALGRAKLAKEAQMLFERMRERFPPDAKTYTVLLSGWCKVKNLTQAGKLWNQMVDEGFKPDLVTHNIMLEGLLNGRKKDEAFKLLDLMKRNGPSPNTRTYTIVIRALCNLKRMDEALKFFAEMRESGCPVDAAVYTCLITGYGTAKKLDRAYELLQEMKEKGIPRDCQTYNALIKVMVDLHKPVEANKLYDEMIQYNIGPTIHTYNMLMKVYFAASKPEMGVDIWNQMVRHGCSPDVNSYTVLIGGLIREGRSQEACTYIESMIEKGMRAPQFDYDKLTAKFSRGDRPDVFEELAEKMKQTGKLDIADVVVRYSQNMKKRAKKRHAVPGGLWSSGKFARFPQRQPRSQSQQGHSHVNTAVPIRAL